MSTQSIRVTDFTKEEFDKLKKSLTEWGYDEWFQYDVIEISNEENVDVSFHLDPSLITMSEFIHLIHQCGADSLYR